MPDWELDRAAASLLTVGFMGGSVNDAVKALIDRGVGGVVLFSRNLGTKSEVRELVRALKAYAGRPLFVAVDQEGGVVQRLRDGVARIPEMRALGTTSDEVLAERLGRVLASQLRAVGVDVDFAPVLDVDTNPRNPVIGSRSLSSDPQVVARLGVAIGKGLESAGVAACGKHFPGHGDTTQDSHLELPRLDHSLERLRAVELVPFRAWCDAGLSSLMTAHVVFSPLDPEYPATMSEPALGGLLRTELGYDGVVFSDDLEMRPILDNFGPREAAERGLRAGVDSFLCCHTASTAHEVIDALIDCARADESLHAQLSRACQRISAFTGRFFRQVDHVGGEAPDVQLTEEECKEVVEEILSRSRSTSMPSGADPTEAAQAVRRQQQEQQ